MAHSRNSNRRLSSLFGTITLVSFLAGAVTGSIIVVMGQQLMVTLSTALLIAFAVSLLGLGIALLGRLVAARILAQIILQPLATLLQAVEQLDREDSHNLLEFSHLGELGPLAAALEELAGRLSVRKAQEESAIAGLAADLAACRQVRETLQQQYDRLQHQNQLLVQTLGTGHLLQRNLNPSSLFQEIVQAIHSSLGFGMVVLSLVDRDAQQLRVRAYVGLDGKERELFEGTVYAWEDFAVLLQERFRIGRCYFFSHDDLSGPVQPQSKAAIGGSNGSGQPRSWDPEDALLVPVELRPGQIEGILSLGQPSDGQRPGIETLQVLEIFASQVATAIENARLYEQVEQDLVERRRAAEQLRRLNEQLEDRVKERTIELARANGTLQAEILERQRIEMQITASLKEKELLLQEIHHRVKNNLQVISSLLNLQAGYVEDQKVREIFQDSQNRVRSMALVHEKLYRSADLAWVDLAEYIHNLATFLFRCYRATAGRVGLEVQADNVCLGIDAAVPCGLILNELISNALKHAFPDDRPGQIRVELRTNEQQQLTLIVSDTGIGFPQDFDFENTTSLGMQLVNTLVQQLNGTLAIDRSNGSTFKIIFTAPQ